MLNSLHDITHLLYHSAIIMSPLHYYSAMILQVVIVQMTPFSFTEAQRKHGPYQSMQPDCKKS